MTGDQGNGRFIYKILLPSEWAQFQQAGQFDGSPLDRQSGFVHCSARAQLAPTARRFFPDEPTLIVVVLSVGALADVRWEAAPGGESFPHVYGPLPRRAVLASYAVPGAALIDEVVP
jgi:uncharacterized protein (DUF952 family)